MKRCPAPVGHRHFGVNMRKRIKCATCGARTPHLKKHVLRHHVTKRWWFLYPTKACWSCRRHEIASHARGHRPFSVAEHLGQFSILIEGFLRYLRQHLHMKSNQQLLDLVKRKRLGKAGAIFDAGEAKVLDAYDSSLGLKAFIHRNTVAPTRVSSLLHWQTLRGLLALCQIRLASGSADNRASDRRSVRKRGSSRRSSADNRVSDRRSAQTSANDRPAYTFYDSHCHLDRLFRKLRFRGDLESFFGEYGISSDGLLGCVTNFCDPANFSRRDPAWIPVEQSPGVYFSIGCHPTLVNYLSDSAWSFFRRQLRDPRCKAVGEIGLDYSRGVSSVEREQQKMVLHDFLRVAVETQKPVVIHCREAIADCFKICRRVLPKRWKIHLHCFTGSVNEAQEWCLHFSNTFLGVTPMVMSQSSRKSGTVRAVVKKMSLTRLLVETDAPYFFPAELPRRRPFGISDTTLALAVVKEVARTRHTTVGAILRHVRRNTQDMYGLCH